MAVALLVLSMALSVSFIISNSAHDCTDIICPICLRIEACLRVFNSFGAILMLFGISATVVLFVSATVFFNRRFSGKPTLVNLKIKLSD